MPLQDIHLSHSEQEYQPLGEWAKRLSIPARTLLHHGAQGDLLLFTLPPPNVDYCSVHEDFVGDSIDSRPSEAQPIPMPEPDVMGLLLANDDCAQLAAGSRVERKLFNAIFRKQGVWSNIIQPVQGHLGNRLRPDGWRITAYQRNTRSEGGERSIPSPVSVKIGVVNVYARDVDVEDFIARLKSYHFISDIFHESRIVEELPDYISGKLRELIEANRIFWRHSHAIDATEKERRRGESLKYLKEDFTQHCDKKSKPDSLRAFAARACDPTIGPKSQQLPSTSVTTAMLALLTAAKLYWAAHCKESPARETYPDADAIVEFLRFMGLREGNTASSGQTLIRPETVRPPKPKPDLLTTVRLRRQGLKP